MGLLSFSALLLRPSHEAHTLKPLSQTVISGKPRLRQVERIESGGGTTNFRKKDITWK